MKKLLVLLSLAALPPNFAFAQDAAIAERLAAGIRAALPGALVSVPDPDGLDITFAGQTQSVGIGSLRDACARNPFTCDTAIQDYTKKAVSYVLEATPFAIDQLTIVVRSRTYLENMALQMGGTSGFVVEPLVGELVSVCYRDLPSGRRPIVQEDLVVVHLEQTSAVEKCKANARESLPRLSSFWNELPENGIGVIHNGDDVTGYLSAPNEWEPLAKRLGVLIVAAPAIDTVLYARGASPVEIDAMATLAGQVHAQASFPMWAQVLKWTDRGWVAVTR